MRDPIISTVSQRSRCSRASPRRGRRRRAASRCRSLAAAREAARGMSANAAHRRARSCGGRSTRSCACRAPRSRACSRRRSSCSGCRGSSARRRELPGFDAADFRTFIVPVGLPAGRRASPGAATGRQPRARHRAGLVRPAAGVPRPARRAAGRHRGVGCAARAAAGDVPVRRRAFARRGLARPARRLVIAGDAASWASPLRGVLGRHPRAAFPHAAGRAADADRQLLGGPLHHRLRARRSCSPTGWRPSRPSTR